MIEKIEGEFFLFCDLCDRNEGPFEIWVEAVEYKVDSAWKSRKDKIKGWMDICPECQKEGQR